MLLYADTLSERLKMKSYKTIDEYIRNFPKDIQTTLQKLRQTIRKAAPNARETIKYGIPTFVQNGNLVHFAAWKTHIGFYPTASPIRSAFKKELSAYKLSKGTVTFPLDHEIPWKLIARIVKFRVKEDALRAKPAKTDRK